MWYIVIAVVAYLIGSISSSVLVSKKMAGFDVREKGSGNAGSTNVLRTVGKKAAVITLICDILKGVIAVALAYTLGRLTGYKTDTNILCQIAAVCVVIGHTFPIFFGFKGGKGVATSLGVLLVMNWNIGLICLVFALVIMAISRMVSLGSISAAVLFPVLVLFTNNNYITGYVSGKGKISWVLFGIVLAALVIFNHRSNITRIREGKENKLSFSSHKDDDGDDSSSENDSNEEKEQEPIVHIDEDVPEIKVEKKKKSKKEDDSEEKIKEDLQDDK